MSEKEFREAVAKFLHVKYRMNIEKSNAIASHKDPVYVFGMYNLGHAPETVADALYTRFK